MGAGDMTSGRAVTATAGMFSGRRLLIFDFDGTIADTTPLHAAAFEGVLRPLGVAVDYHAIAGLRTSDAIRHLLGLARVVLDDAAVEALVVAKQAAVRATMRTSLQPLPGADRFLRRARGKREMALVTSGSQGTVNLALDALGYAGWFLPVVCSEDVARAKPDPEGFLRALSLKRVPAGEAIVFEDSSAGIAAALAAGIDVIDVTAVDWEDLVENLD